MTSYYVPGTAGAERRVGDEEWAWKEASNAGRGELGPCWAVSCCRPHVKFACLQPEFQKPLTPRYLPGPSLQPSSWSCRKCYGRGPKAHKVHVDQNKQGTSEKLVSLGLGSVPAQAVPDLPGLWEGPPLAPSRGIFVHTHPPVDAVFSFMEHQVVPCLETDSPRWCR